MIEWLLQICSNQKVKIMLESIIYWLDQLRCWVQKFNYIQGWINPNLKNRYLTLALESSVAILAIILVFTDLNVIKAFLSQVVYLFIIYALRDIKDFILYLKIINRLLWTIIYVWIGFWIYSNWL
ncbi:hypothetical protein A9K75_06710 [Campylobacter fetus subsp. testudinum]|uniref:hypothetical protein n=1 Tax=Campylobacter fetus TaxID=196 RepID=UPI000818B5AC|nr:hypothetical protein [Campylobacter fetus]OCR99556.1 hypothetical protein A9K75_06710 [Campylobacter fetus subsp. testudinum]